MPRILEHLGLGIAGIAGIAAGVAATLRLAWRTTLAATGSAPLLAAARPVPAPAFPRLGIAALTPILADATGAWFAVFRDPFG